MKKIISLILCFTMLFCLCVSASAASFTDTNNVKSEVAINTLVDLGVINGYPDGSFHPTADVTRAEMATLVMKVLGYTNPTTVVSVFKDVPVSHYAASYISVASALGIINGYGNGYFGPDDNVTYEQAIAMVIRALGYTDEVLAKTEGQYWAIPYVYKAINLGILEGFGMGADNADREEIAQILYNTLNETIVTVSNSYAGPVVNDSTGDTMLKRLGATVTKEVLLYTDNIKVIDTIGQYCSVYKNKDSKVIAVTSLATTLIGAVKNDKFVVGSDSYTIDSAAYTGALTFANGEKTATTLSAGNVSGYTVLNCELSGSTITKIYSASNWSGTTVQVTKTILDNLSKNKFGSYNFAVKDDAINPNSYALHGVRALEDLEVGNMVTVYLRDSKIIRLDASQDTVSGTVDKITTTSGVTKYEISGVAYELASGVGALTLGTSYKCYLDYTGKIAKADVVTTVAQNVGIFVGTDTVAGLSGADRIGYYTYDDIVNVTVKTLSIAKPSYTANDLFTFTFDKNGAVNSTTKGTASAATIISGQLVKLDSASYRLADNLVIFAVDDSDVLSVTTLDKVKKGVDIGAAQYLLDSDSKVIALRIDATYADIETGTGYCVINSITSVTTAKGTILEINGFVDGSTTTFNTVDDSVISTAAAHSLYKIGYSGADAKTLTKQTPAVNGVTVAEKSDNLIKGSDSNWYSVSSTAIAYEYNATTSAYTVSSYVPYGATIYMYDISPVADGVYDVIIYTV